ncbi:MAG: winged helix-turn-helix transcriptional regulator [Candidatus Lokiarchaeota archaeon]|nr:winged helix-turn-helix transcriptional regulator [Candidatus Lokiarchaeota archaeon]
MGFEKLNNRKSSKKFTYFSLLKFGLIIFSLVILSVVLYQLIKSMDDFLGPTEEITLRIVLVSILIVIILLLSIFEVLTVKEYRGYFIRKPFIQKGKSYLTLSDIFENENRLNILREIINNPGIHQNELLRNCDLQKGQLQWHLDVLLKNRIIKKEKYGQYTIYFPITSSIEEIDQFKNLPTKSETTTKIFELVQKYPGISSSEISKKINLARNTVKYHIDKLSEKGLIYLKENGRKIELYPNV